MGSLMNTPERRQIPFDLFRDQEQFSVPPKRIQSELQNGQSKYSYSVSYSGLYASCRCRAWI